VGKGMKEGWEIKRLGDVCNLQNGYAFKSNDYIEVSNTLNIRMSSIRPDGSFDPEHNQKYLPDSFAKEYATFLLNEGDLVIAMTDMAGDPKILGVPALVKNKNSRNFLMNQRVGKLFGFLGDVHIPFLSHFLGSPSIREFYKSKGTGGLQINISKEDILSATIPLPPLPEQHRIVRILDEAFEWIATAKANAEKNLANAREIFESYLQEVFTKRGEGWEETTLGNEIDLIAGFAFKSAEYTDSKKSIRLLRGDNIIQRAIRWDDVKKWPSSDIANYKNYQLCKGDVVLAMDRPWVKAGLKHAMISTSDLPCLLVQRTARLRCGPKINNNFLFFMIGCPAFTQHILGSQTGIGVPHISGQQIKDFSFLRPPMPVQRQIADNLESLWLDIHRLESLYQQKLSTLESLNKSLLHQAFTGGL
jgi:type I restriction enzyme S subunit